jgi:hypothetical protein
MTRGCVYEVLLGLVCVLSLCRVSQQNLNNYFVFVRDRKLPLQFTWILLSSTILRIVSWFRSFNLEGATDA